MSSTPGYVPALKGLAISASFLTAGSLITTSQAVLPGILHALDISTTASPATPAKAAAQQFAIVYKAAKATQPPTEILATLVYGFLAWYYKNKTNDTTGSWKLYAAAAGAMFSVIPYTISLMEGISFKLVTLANSRTSQTERPALTKQKSNPSLLVIPPGDKAPAGAMTPAEEFEPYEDAPFSEDDYERMKVTKMLRQFNTRNSVRSVLVLLSGVFGTWAALSE